MNSIQCMTCKFYFGLSECEAFPKGIPQKILDGTIDHKEPVAGDNNIQWQPLDNVAKDVMDNLDEKES